MVFSAKTFGIIFISDCQAHDRTVVTDVINNKVFDKLPNNVRLMLNIEPQIENMVLHLNKTNNKCFCFM